MRSWRPVRRFALILLVVYALLIVPWPVVTPVTAAVIRFCYATVMKPALARSFVSVLPKPDNPDHHARINVIDRRVRARPIDVGFRWINHYPTAFFIALVVAAPVSWMRRLKVLALGVPLMLAFTTLKFCLPLLDAMAQPPLHLFDPGALIEWPVGLVAPALDNAPVLYVVPALLWLILTFRRGELTAILQPPASG